VGGLRSAIAAPRSTSTAPCSRHQIGAPLRGRRSEPIQRDLRLDHIPPQDIEALEVYAGAATTPAEFSATAAPGLKPGCTIVIWTR